VDVQEPPAANEALGTGAAEREPAEPAEALADHPVETPASPAEMTGPVAGGPDPGAVAVPTATPEGIDGTAQSTPQPARLAGQESSGDAGHPVEEEPNQVENESSTEAECVTANIR
jgi:hypothetical protein